MIAIVGFARFANSPETSLVQKSRGGLQLFMMWEPKTLTEMFLSLWRMIWMQMQIDVSVATKLPTLTVQLWFPLCYYSHDQFEVQKQNIAWKEVSKLVSGHARANWCSKLTTTRFRRSANKQFKLFQPNVFTVSVLICTQPDFQVVWSSPG